MDGNLIDWLAEIAAAFAFGVMVGLFINSRHHRRQAARALRNAERDIHDYANDLRGE